MASTTVNKFGGLYLQPNSMEAPPGSFEQLENCVRLYDNIVSSRRGYQEAYHFVTGQQINHIFEYQTSAFAVSQNAIYNLSLSSTTAQAACANGSAVVTVTKTAHGLTSNDYISMFFVVDTEQAFYNAFPSRHAAFYGVFQVTVLTANTFTFAASENATASVTTSAGAASYLYYTRQAGVSVAVTPTGVERSRSLETNKNAYFLTDKGPFKLERVDLPVLKAGIPQGLDLSGVLGQSTQVPPTNVGPIPANSQVAYRILFGRRDANSNLVLGAPSESLVLSNTLTTPSGLSYAATVLTITSIAHGFPNVAPPAGVVYLYNVVATGGTVANGTAIAVTYLDPNTFSIDFSTIGAGGISAVTSLDYGISKTPRIYFSIPSEIASTQYIYQVYRTESSATATSSPIPQYKLVTEQNLTSAEVSAGLVSYIDELPEVLIQGAAELYTNIGTQEGELQANSRPPFAKDFALYRGRVFYANTKPYPILELAVVAPGDLSNGTVLTLGAQDYVFRKNASNNSAVVNTIAVSSATRVATTITVTQNNHGFSNSDTIYVLEDVGLTVTPNVYTVSGVTTNTFAFTSAGVAGTGTVTYEGRQNAAGKWLVKAYIPDVGTTTTAEAIDGTARALVKAINRNSSSTIYAQYISGIGDVPGEMLFTAKDVNATAFTATISAAFDGEAFFPTVPTSGTTVQSTQTLNINEIAIAKENEPEAVPLTNTLLVSSGNKAILRIAALRDSLIIVKEDGVYRLTGDSPANYSVTPIDVTVICKSKNSVSVLNNSVFCFSNQGVVQITDNAAQIVSREIEPVLSAILVRPSTDIATATNGFSYESDREYVLSTLGPNDTGAVPTTCYVFNYLTNAWSRWDSLFYSATVIPSVDLTYYVGLTQNIIYKERKQQKKSDFADQEFAIPTYLGKVSSADALIASSTVTITLAVPHGLKVGDLITVAGAATALSALFSGGSADLLGLRVVTSVINLTSFTFSAATSATSSISAQELDYEDFISELLVASVATIGSPVVSITTPIAHGLNTGNGIIINQRNMGTAFPTATDITGFRTITVTSATTFTITATNPAASSQTSTVMMTDQRQTYYYITLKPAATLVPEVGDALVYNNILYKILETYEFSTTSYLVRLNYQALFQSYQAPFLYSAIEKSIKFSPMTMGDVGKLKYFDVFQCQFRAQGNCSAMTVDFACDTKSTSGNVSWVDRVGSDEAQITFDGFGEIAWGTDPWGEGESIDKDYTTGPAVILRTYINQDAASGTFIQPVLMNNVAGEELNIQAVSFDFEMVSTVSTR